MPRINDIVAVTRDDLTYEYYQVSTRYDSDAPRKLETSRVKDGRTDGWTDRVKKPNRPQRPPQIKYHYVKVRGDSPFTPGQAASAFGSVLP